MKLHHKFANAFGYQLINKKNSDLMFDTHLMRLLKKYKPSLTLDVGANVGQFGKKLRTAGFQNEILSFEPIPSIYQELSNLVQTDDKWKAFNYALGDVVGEATIHVPKYNSSFSSLLPNNQYSKQRFENQLKEMNEETIKIEVLDDLLAKGFLNPATNKDVFLKLDTQGYDLKVLQGANKFLDNVQIVLTELSFIPIYDGMPTFIEMSDYLLSRGFTPSGFFPVSRDKNSLAVIEMDGFFIRKS